MARESCQGAPTARTPRITHAAQISPWGPRSRTARRSCQGPLESCQGAPTAQTPQIMHSAQILPSSGDLCLSVARCPSLRDGGFRFFCFGGARSSVLVRRTIPPCRLGYGILELLGLRHPCLAGKPPALSPSSRPCRPCPVRGYLAAVFSAGWRASASPLRRLETGHKKGGPVWIPLLAGKVRVG